MSNTKSYTFGDTQLAQERLRLLAETYAPATEDLLHRRGRPGVDCAIDLGSGPGHTTRLLHRVLSPKQTYGLDSSSRFVAEAAEGAPKGVSFIVHDITRAPFPTPPAELFLCRYLLTHLSSPTDALAVWAQAAGVGAQLFIQETETLESDEPVLARYYALVGELQRRYGQALYVGSLLDGALARSPWTVQSSQVKEFSPAAPTMARLHVMNLRTWRQNPVARESFDPGELTELEGELEAIAAGRRGSRPVRQGLREIVATTR